MSPVASIAFIEITRPQMQEKSISLLANWLCSPSEIYGKRYTICYELSRALHDYCYDESNLYIYRYNTAIRSPYITKLTHEEQKELASWIYVYNISHTPHY